MALHAVSFTDSTSSQRQPDFLSLSLSPSLGRHASAYISPVFFVCCGGEMETSLLSGKVRIYEGFWQIGSLRPRMAEHFHAALGLCT